MSNQTILSTAVAGVLFAALTLPALAASNICDFHAYADDRDPGGTNVRSGPGTDYGIVGVLKVVHAASGYDWSPEFDVTAFDDGWFRIGDASIGDFGDTPPGTVFEGPGWISSRLVGFEIEDPQLRAGPSLDAATLLDMNSIYDPANDWNLDEVRVQAVYGCEGGFLDVVVTNLSGERRRGWITDLCGNQATTCS